MVLSPLLQTSKRKLKAFQKQIHSEKCDLRITVAWLNLKLPKHSSRTLVYLCSWYAGRVHYKCFKALHLRWQFDSPGLPIRTYSFQLEDTPALEEGKVTQRRKINWSNRLRNWNAVLTGWAPIQSVRYFQYSSGISTSKDSLWQKYKSATISPWVIVICREFEI